MTAFEPALCLTLRVIHVTDTALHVIMAADGTVLDATEETAETLPRWIAGLVQLPTVEVTPGVYRHWKRDYAARPATPSR